MKSNLYAIIVIQQTSVESLSSLVVLEKPSLMSITDAEMPGKWWRRCHHFLTWENRTAVKLLLRSKLYKKKHILETLEVIWVDKLYIGDIYKISRWKYLTAIIKKFWYLGRKSGLWFVFNKKKLRGDNRSSGST